MPGSSGCEPSHLFRLIEISAAGLRSVRTVNQLLLFLRGKIFPLLQPLGVEIYIKQEEEIFSLPGWTVLTFALDAGLCSLAELSERKNPVYFSAQLPTVAGQHVNSADQDRHYRHHLFLPLVHEAVRYGMVYIGSPAQTPFTREQIACFAAFSALLVSRLNSLEIIQKLTAANAAYEYSEHLRSVFHEISEKAHTLGDMQLIYQAVSQGIKRLVPFTTLCIALQEQDKCEGKTTVNCAFCDTDVDSVAEDQAQALDYLMQFGQPLLLEPENCRYHLGDNLPERFLEKPFSWLGAPFYSSHASGAVVIEHLGRRVYSEQDKELVAFAARQIGEALHRKHSLDELQQAKERAEEAEKNKGIFLANMSHEIRTPMNGIIGMTELVMESGVSDQQYSYLKMVHSSAERLLKLINDILDFSKIEAGKLDLQIEAFSLRNSIANSLQILAFGAAEKNIDLSVQCNPEIPDTLYGDAGKISQILINLIGNAIKFTQRGGVTLVVENVSHHEENPQQFALRFSVQDTGIGIPADKINMVFTAFSQLGTNRDSNNPGTGLGLVIAAQLVEMMGGKLEVKSTVGIGTTFFFTLSFSCGTSEHPCLQKPLNTEQEAVSSRLRQDLHILLVEDEFVNRTLAVAVLGRQGWRVETAENGRQALQMLMENLYDLVLMDIQMPELNGFEVTTHIREAEKKTGKHQPIIAMTAYAARGDREKCLAAGMDGYVSKPIHSDDLKAEIERILQLSTNPPH